MSKEGNICIDECSELDIVCLLKRTVLCITTFLCTKQISYAENVLLMINIVFFMHNSTRQIWNYKIPNAMHSLIIAN